MPADTLEPWKRIAYYDCSPLGLASPYNVPEALKTFLFLCYDFIVLPDIPTVKAMII